MIENVVVNSSEWHSDDLATIFADDANPDPGYVHFTDAKDLPNLLKELNIFPSTGAARRAGRDGPIPKGYTELKASKKRRLFIWNPTEPKV